MGYIPDAVDHVARKIARIEGVEQSFVCRDGAVDAILEGGYNRPLRAEILAIGQRAMVPVRVFYRMEDGRAIGEEREAPREEPQDDLRRTLAAIDRMKQEGVEDYYTPIYVAGFAGEPAVAPPDRVAGDSYPKGDIKKNDDRDDYGQLKLCRIRGKTRGRPVIGWQYGTQTVKAGAQVKFKKNAALQWTLGRTMNVRKGATGRVTGVASKRPLAFLSVGGYDQIELPIHAIGHVYDVMVDPKLESRQLDEVKANTKLGYLTPELKRLVMTVGFGRPPGSDETGGNSPHFRGPEQPDLIGYSEPDAEEEHDDFLGDKQARGTISKATINGKRILTGKRSKV